MYKKRHTWGALLLLLPNGIAYAGPIALFNTSPPLRFFDADGHLEMTPIHLPENEVAATIRTTAVPTAYYPPDSSTQSIVGPSQPRRWADHIPDVDTPYPTFGSRVRRIKWETIGLLGWFTVINSPKLFKPLRGFHFEDEGWFGKSTTNLGVDKLTHAFNTYLVAEFLHARLHKKTGGVSGDATTAAILATGLMIYSEFYDSIETTGGFSLQDVAMNSAGASFSVLRNTVPGLKDKLDFRLLIMPNKSIYTRTGLRHYRQQRHLLALQLSGFDAFRKTPLRFMELHTGYYASGFTWRERLRGEPKRRHLFFGIGLNVRELFFKNATKGVGLRAGQLLDYYQIPYTAAHWDY